MIRALVLALALLPTSVTAQSVAEQYTDYPTAARADYVFACMVTNGQSREMLDAAPAPSTRLPPYTPMSRILKRTPENVVTGTLRHLERREF